MRDNKFIYLFILPAVVPRQPESKIKSTTVPQLPLSQISLILDSRKSTEEHAGFRRRRVPWFSLQRRPPLPGV